MNFADLTEETTTATSTATVSLLGASSVLMRAFAAAFAIGTTEIPVRVYDTLGNFEIGLYTLTSAALLTRTSIIESSNNDLAVTFPAGTKKVACVLPASVIADFGRLSQGVGASGLPVGTSMASEDSLLYLQGGVEKTIPASIVKTFMAAAADVTAPTLSSPTGTQTGSTTASGTVSTDDATGTLYYLATTNATETAATVKASGGTQVIATSGSKSVSFTALSAGTTYYAHYLHRDSSGNDSAVANSASFTTASAADVTAPTLSAPLGAQTGATTGSGGVTTNEGNGTLYYLATVNATESAATVKASGATLAITSTGAKVVTFSGLNASTPYYPHYLHRDASGNDSLVSTGASFTTAAAGDTTAPILSAPLGTSTGSTTASGGATTNEANGTLYRYVSANATETAATIKAANLTTTISATGAIATAFTGLTASTIYYAHYVHRDAAGNDSNVVSSTSFTTAAAEAAYTITPNSAAANPYTSISQSTFTTDYGTVRRYKTDRTAASRYWLISGSPASAEAGWGPSSTTPPASVTLAQNNSSGVGSLNGLVPMDHPVAWGTSSDLLAPAGASGPWFFFVKPAGGAAQCMNAGAPLYITA